MIGKALAHYEITSQISEGLNWLEDEATGAGESIIETCSLHIENP